jgi:hypothetical protein
VDDVRLKLAHLHLQLLKAAQVAGVEGHVLAVDCPEQRLLLFVIQLGQIQWRAGQMLYMYCAA